MAPRPPPSTSIAKPLRGSPNTTSDSTPGSLYSTPSCAHIGAVRTGSHACAPPGRSCSAGGCRTPSKVLGGASYRDDSLTNGHGDVAFICCYPFHSQLNLTMTVRMTATS